MASKYALVALALMLLPLGAAHAAPCPERKQEAIRLANEGDVIRKVDADGAIARYEAALAIDPTDHRVLAKLGSVLLGKQAWARAGDVFDRAAALAPTFATYAMNAGRARVEEGRLTEARERLEKAVALDANLWKAHVELALLALRLHDRPGYDRRAAEHLVRAIALEPRQPEAYQALGELYHRLRHDDEAKQVLEAGLAALAAPNFELLTVLGVVERARGDDAAAIARYEEAKRTCGACSEPRFVGIYYNLGVAYATERTPRRAEAVLQLQTFEKRACKGVAAKDYGPQCERAASWLQRFAKGP